MDRIDIHVEVTPVDFDKLVDKSTTEKSAEVRKRVICAREIQEERFNKVENVYCNAQMSSKLIRRHCVMGGGVRKAIENSYGKVRVVG